jgi:hypothetical protein
VAGRAGKGSGKMPHLPGKGGSPKGHGSTKHTGKPGTEAGQKISKNGNKPRGGGAY